MAKNANSSQETSQDASNSAGKESTLAADSAVSNGNGKYTVVARRYRPKTFEELVGQSTVAQALVSAIQSNRVGHAYLFTGARGVGKTSTARIFAKALNASAETNGKFDPSSDIAQAIDAGEDMDVIEIDGASNRGIDEIRQLRANAAVRPSRSRYKIYIIDEVHMLTTQAFNALLKTLEEPPGHVKFIFCTTDPEKMPITVLSRCQRFDFPPVQADEIYERLKFICQNEGMKADEAALRLVARRASGSMRDSQSLLEQLLSFSGNEITADIVHAMLGTADESRLSSFALRMIERDAAGALLELDSAASEGVDVGQLAEQLLGYLRDMMAMSVGGHPDLIRTANPNSATQLAEWGKSWGTMTLLSALQLLDETIVKMRHSVQSRVLLEVALVQICNLQDLQSLSELVRAFTSRQPTPAARPAPAKPLVAPAQPKAEPESKKKDELTPPVVTAAPPSVAPAESTIQEKSPDANQPPAPLPPAPQPIGNSELVSSPEKAIHEVAPSQVPSLAVHENATTSPAETLTAQATAAHREPETPASAQSMPIASVSAQPNSDNARQVENQVTSDAKTEPPVQPEEVASDDLSQFRFVAKNLGGFAEQCASMAVFVESLSESQWKIGLSRDGGMVRDYFQTGENCRRLTQAIKKQMGRDIHLSFTVTDQINPNPEVAETPLAAELVETAPAVTGPVIPQSQLIRNAMNDPLVKQFMDTFEGQIVRVDPGRAKVAAPHLLKNREAAPEPIGERPTVHS